MNVDDIAEEKYSLLIKFGIKTEDAADRYLRASGFDETLIIKILSKFACKTKKL